MPLRKKVDQVSSLSKAWRTADAKMRSEMVNIYKKASMKILEESKKNAPLDKGNLEKAHRLIVIKSGNGKVSLAIEVGNFEFVRGGKRVNVNQYAIEMHEGNYKLGPRSSLKNATGPNTVGRKYLSRAYDEKADEVLDEVADKIFKDFL